MIAAHNINIINLQILNFLFAFTAIQMQTHKVHFFYFLQGSGHAQEIRFSQRTDMEHISF